MSEATLENARWKNQEGKRKAHLPVTTEQEVEEFADKKEEKVYLQNLKNKYFPRAYSSGRRDTAIPRTKPYVLCEQ